MTVVVVIVVVMTVSIVVRAPLETDLHAYRRNGVGPLLFSTFLLDNHATRFGSTCSAFQC